MQHLAALTLASLLALGPAVAQEEETRPPGDMEEGFNLVEEWMKLFFRGLAEEMEVFEQHNRFHVRPDLRLLHHNWKTPSARDGWM